MTDTLTYNPTDPDAGELTPEEQDSLEVGEKLAEQEEQLLAGKYRNAEELEKAYTELEKKLGSNEEPEQEPETIEEEDDTETPGVALLNEANVEYWDNDGQLSEETIEKFSSMSSKELVEAYLQVSKDNPPENLSESNTDIAERDINIIQNSVGGEAEYAKLTEWAADNLPENAINAFDTAVSSGNIQMIQLAVTGLKAEYDSANGYEGRMLSGKAVQTSSDVFRSQAEVVAAMSDPRYDRDPAYRNDIYEKLDRSDLKF